MASSEGFDAKEIKEKLEAAGYVLGETGFVRLDK